MPLLRNPWIVIDTETTGLLPRRAALPCEVAAVYLEPEVGRIVSTFTSLIRVPVEDWASYALAVSGITPAEIAAAPTPDAVLAAFGAWAGALPQQGVQLTAFNVPFDRAMLERLWPYEMPWGACLMVSAGRVMRRENAEVMKDRKGSPNLAMAAEYFAVPVEGQAHRALADALRAARLLVALASRREAAASAGQAEPVTIE